MPCLKHVLGSFEGATVGVPQLSVAVGAVQLTNVQLSMLTKVMLAGQRVKVGFVKSVAQRPANLVTVTVKTHSFTLPRASLAV